MHPICCFLVIPSTCDLSNVGMQQQYNGTNILKSHCLFLENNNTKRRQVYNDLSTHSVVLPYPPWTSAQVLAQISYILLSEVMNYETDLLPHNTNDAGDFLNFAAGCVDPDSLKT